jgi:glutathione S-transferase
MKLLETPELKTTEFEAINPNGKVPAIVDPNTEVTLWESGAIIQYLLENYDKDSSISFKSVPEKYQVDQWLFFQASGQGPYFGQAYCEHALSQPNTVKRLIIPKGLRNTTANAFPQ